MKRLFLYPLGLFLVISMACALLPTSSSPSATSVPPLPAIQSTEQTMPTEVVLPTEPPQSVPPTQQPQLPAPTQSPQPAQPTTPPQPSQPTTPPQPAQQQPTTASTQSTSFTDNFDVASQNWSDVITTTTQAKGGHMYSKITTVDGFLTFDLLDKETYDYMFYKNTMPADVTMELKFYNTQQLLNNGIALVCRASSDYSTWIEFRISSQGNYAIYHFDKSLKAQYKNPYVAYIQGVADRNIISPLPTIENDIKASCIGPNLTLTLNDKQTVTTTRTDITDGGFVGLGVLSGDFVPVNVNIDSFTTAAK
jgi:hypothetical protein